MSSIDIEVKNLSKRYRIGLKEEIHDTFIESLSSWLRSPLLNYRKVHSLSSFSDNGESDDIIWALKNVSFQIQQGEVVGIIGRNGAGKSTLLKILSRITEPTEGKAVINGNVASLLEVGTGFHPELTGRENLYLNGAILGMKRNEIDRKFNEIVSFSGVENFIDTPVKRYSSGMRVRLAFSVAAYLEPDILLVDEVLAVGDIEFQNKCIRKMDSLSSHGRTIILVSHNMSSIQRLCDRAILMDKGRILNSGSTNEIISDYYSHSGLNNSRVFIGKIDEKKEEDVSVLEIILLDNKGNSKSIFDRAYPFIVEVQFEVRKTIKDLSVVFTLWAMGNVMVCKSFNIDNETNNRDKYDPGKYISKLEFPGRLLNHGNYSFDIKIQGRKTFFRSGQINFVLKDSKLLPSTARTPKYSDQILLSMPLNWEIKKL